MYVSFPKVVEVVFYDTRTTINRLITLFYIKTRLNCDKPTPTQCTIVVSSNCAHLLQRGMCPYRRTISWPLFKTCLYPRYCGSVD